MSKYKYESELLDRLIPEELMRESKTYQRQMERAAERVTKGTTVRHILALLKRQFRSEIVNTLAPAIENIDDLQRLEQLLIAASETQNIEAFAQMLHE